MSEPGPLVDRKAHQSSGSMNRAKNQSRERQQLRQLIQGRSVAQSFRGLPKASQIIRFTLPGRRGRDLQRPSRDGRRVAAVDRLNQNSMVWSMEVVRPRKG